MIHMLAHIIEQSVDQGDYFLSSALLTSEMPAAENAVSRLN